MLPVGNPPNSLAFVPGSRLLDRYNLPPNNPSYPMVDALTTTQVIHSTYILHPSTLDSLTFSVATAK